MIDRVTIRRLAELSGYTEKAIRAKIERGIWPQGVMWDYAPDGRIKIILEAYNEWDAGRVSGSSGGRSSSISDGRASGAAKGSG